MKLLKIWDVKQKGESKVRTICGTIVVAAVATTCMVGAASEAENMPPVASAKMPEAKHVFSMRTHTTVNSTTTGCTGSDGRMSAGGGIDRKKKSV